MSVDTTSRVCNDNDNHHNVNTVARNSTEIALMYMTLEYIGRLYTTQNTSNQLPNGITEASLSTIEKRFYNLYLDLPEEEKSTLSPYLRIFTMGKFLQNKSKSVS